MSVWARTPTSKNVRVARRRDCREGTHPSLQGQEQFSASACLLSLNNRTLTFHAKVRDIQSYLAAIPSLPVTALQTQRQPSFMYSSANDSSHRPDSCKRTVKTSKSATDRLR